MPQFLSINDPLYLTLHPWIQSFVPDILPDIEIVPPGAGYRTYYRIKTSNNKTYVVSVYTQNGFDSYIKCSLLLQNYNIPEIYFSGKIGDIGIMILEDLGTTNLLQSVEYYKPTIDLLVNIQNEKNFIEQIELYSETKFYNELCLMEEWYLQNLLHYECSFEEKKDLSNINNLIVKIIVNQPYGPIHRDFHSENIMIHKNKPYIIDFQDLCHGPLTYDVASLLKDIYHVFDIEERNELLQYYCEKKNITYDDNFVKLFDYMCLQRHISILAWFSRLSLTRNKMKYIGFIPTTLNYIYETCEKYKELAPLKSLLEKANARLDIPCIILAAGKGERMKPLTDILPKPLLQVRGKTLLGHHLHALSCCLFKNKVVTAYWLQDQIVDFVGETCKVSREKELLGIAGGIKNALSLINPLDYFIVVNSDVFIPQFNFLEFYNVRYKLKNSDNCQGFLFLTENPDYNLRGDFYLSDDGYIGTEGVGKKYTFTGVAMYHKSLFTNVVAGDSLYPLLTSKHKLMGKVMDSDWYDVGTPERFNKVLHL